MTQRTPMEQLRERVLRTMRRRYSSPKLTLDDCLPPGASRRTAQRALRPEGFRSLLTEHRLGQAADMLTGGQLTVREVSRLVGYSQAPQFIQAFRDRYGCTPSQYRKRGTSPVLKADGGATLTVSASTLAREVDDA